MNDTTPLVSTVVTTYDRPTLARRAIRSALNQSYDHQQVIVVEDASDTDIEEWLASEFGEAVTYVCHDGNRGLAAARNTGLNHADGRYVAYLDDDDEWQPNRLERQIELVQNLSRAESESLGVVYSGATVAYADRPSVRVHPENTGPLRAAIIEHGASTIPSTCLFVRSVLTQIGGFDETLRSGIDHDIWMELATHGYHAYAVDEPLVVVHEDHTHAMTTNTHNRIEGMRQYTEKWTPTYCRWFGEREGTQYADRYFARVIGSLAATKIGDGHIGEGLTALFAVFRYSDEYVFTLRNVCPKVVWSCIVGYAPLPVVNGLRRLLPVVAH